MNFDPAYARSNGATGNVLGLPGSVESMQVQSLLKQIPAVHHRGHLEAGDLDVLLGGPPCQGFSLNSHIRSAEDPRNHLFRHYIRILRALSPKVFVLENVPGMLSLEGGAFLNELVEDLTQSLGSQPGYEVSYKILNAAHYGVPQDRFRIVVVGTRSDVAQEVGRAVSLPTPKHYSAAQAHFKGGRTHTFHYAMQQSSSQVSRGRDIPGLLPALLPPVPVVDAIGDLPVLSNGGGDDTRAYPRKSKLSAYQAQARERSDALRNHWSRQLMPPNTERVKHIPVGGDWRSIPKDFDVTPVFHPALARVLW